MQNKAYIQKKQKEAAPRTTQQTIKYKRMFDDGICEIEPGLYSKCLLLNDINYQIARREEQVDVFTKYSECLNYFDPAINLQISLINRHIDSDNFNDQMLLKPQGDNLDKYRTEYNHMLQEKALQGQNSIVHVKHLTFAAKANDYLTAIAVLARIETEIIGNFKALGCEVVALTGIQRLEFLHDFFLPNEKFDFDYGVLEHSNLITKDFIAPDSFNFTEKKHFEFGDQFGQTIFVKDFSKDMSDKFLSDISEVPCNMVVTLHINSEDQEKALTLVETKLSLMEQQKIDEQKKAQKAGYDPEMIPQRLKRQLVAAEELLDDLQNKNQRMFNATILIYTFSGTMDGLEENMNQIMGVVRKHSCKTGYLDYMQEQGMNSTLPLGKNYIDIKRTLTTASTAIFIPFTTQELYQPSGMYYGLNALSRNLIFLNRKNLKNANGFILGTPGSGKSFSSKREMVNVLLNNPNDDVLIIDPEREYTLIAENFGGEIIHISAGSQAHINPMDMTMDYADNDDPLTLKSEFVLSLCELLVGRGGLSAAQKTIVDRACNLTYQPHFANPTKCPLPTLKEFYQVLMEQPEAEAKSIALSLELYINGSLSVFAHPTNIDTQSRLIVYDIRDLGKQLKTLGLLIVLDQVWNRITKNRQLGKRTWIYIDEIYLLFQNDYSANYLFELYKRARKWGAIPTGITQNVEDLLLSDTARRMLSNTEFIMMLNQATSDRMELAHLLNISEQQLYYVTNASPGQGLLFAGSAIIPFIDQFPQNTELYRMMTTKFEEVTADEAMKDSKIDKAEAAI